MANKQLYVVSWIKPDKRSDGKKSFFDRIGHGFQNKDGSFNFWLEKLPVEINSETTFHIAPYRPREERGGDRFEE